MPSATEARPRLAQEALVEALQSHLSSSRVTLRLRTDVGVRLVAESLAPGVTSMRAGTQEDADRFPTYRYLEQTREVLVQDDLVSHEVRPPRSLIEEYHTYAQMLAPVTVGEDMVGVVSVHQVEAPRSWTTADVEALSAVAKAVALLERLNAETGPSSA